MQKEKQCLLEILVLNMTKNIILVKVVFESINQIPKKKKSLVKIVPNFDVMMHSLIETFTSLL